MVWQKQVPGTFFSRQSASCAAPMATQERPRARHHRLRAARSDDQPDLTQIEVPLDHQFRQRSDRKHNRRMEQMRFDQGFHRRLHHGKAKTMAATNARCWVMDSTTCVVKAILSSEGGRFWTGIPVGRSSVRNQSCRRTLTRGRPVSRSAASSMTTLRLGSQFYLVA